MWKAGKRRNAVQKSNRKERRKYLIDCYKYLVYKVERESKEGHFSCSINIRRLWDYSKIRPIKSTHLVSSDVFPRLLAYYFHKKHPSYYIRLCPMIGRINWYDGAWIRIYWDNQNHPPFDTHWYTDSRPDNTETALASEINKRTEELEKSWEVVTKEKIDADAEELLENLEKVEEGEMTNDMEQLKEHLKLYLR